MDAVPAGGCGLAGAAISVIQGAPPLFSNAGSLMPPEIAGARAVIRLVWPPVVATVGVLPVLAARHLPAGRSAAEVVGGLAVPVLVLVGAVGLWIRHQNAVHEWLRSAFAETSGRGPAGGER